MKTKLFFLFLAISVFTIRIDAQIKIHNNGGISIGSTTEPLTEKTVFADPVETNSGLSTDGEVHLSGVLHLTPSLGNVGIGTETPSTLGGFGKVLDVLGASSSKLSATTTSGGITTSLMSSTYGSWGGVGTQSNHPFQIWANSAKLIIYPSGEANLIGHLRLGSYSNKTTLSTTGSYGSANGFDFNSSSSNRGIIMEQGVTESSGFYADGDFAVIWSPGDQGRLLRIYDEDGMVEKWYLDASGYAHTQSDLSRKENIKEINSVTSKLKNLRGVSYNYKSEDHTNTDNSGTSINADLPKTLEGEIDSLLIVKEGINDTEKTQPSIEEYFGFIAQEVESVFPELVSTDENGNKFVSYTEFIPLLVEAVKEQEARINMLEKQMRDKVETE